MKARKVENYLGSRLVNPLKTQGKEKQVIVAFCALFMNSVATSIILIGRVLVHQFRFKV